MLKKLVGWIVKELLEYLDLWIERERRESAESKARAAEGQLKSIKVSRAAEVRINKPISITPGVAVPLLSPLEWNRGARRGAGTPGSGPSNGLILLVASLVFLCAGCFTRTTFIESRWPIIETPARPTVSEETGWTGREKQLLLYAVTLEARVELYNREAEAHNRQHGYELGSDTH